MGYSNYKINFENMELSYYIEHTRYSGSALYVYGVPPCEIPDCTKITIIFNGIRPIKEKLTNFQELDDKIFKANKKIISKYLTGREFKVDMWDKLGRYRVKLWDSLQTTGYSYPEEITPYYFTDKIEAFNFGDIVFVGNKEYSFIKFSITNNVLTFALLDNVSGDIELINHDKISSSPTRSYNIKYPENFYYCSKDEGDNIIQKGSIFTIHSNYENEVLYKGVNNEEYTIFSGNEIYFNDLISPIQSFLGEYEDKKFKLITELKVWEEILEEESRKLLEQNKILLDPNLYLYEKYEVCLKNLLLDIIKPHQNKINTLQGELRKIENHIEAIKLHSD